MYTGRVLGAIHTDGKGSYMLLTFKRNKNGVMCKAFLTSMLRQDGVQCQKVGQTIAFLVREGFDNESFAKFVAPGVQQARVALIHAGYFAEIQFIAIQHMYIGSDQSPFVGWVELLEIQNPLPRYRPIVVFENWGTHGRRFYEFRDLESAKACFGKIFSQEAETLKKKDGLLRTIECGSRLPWFYANEECKIEGDFAVEGESSESSK